MQQILVIYVLVLVLSLIRAEQKTEVQKPEVTKLEVVNLGEAEIGSDTEQSDVQRKRDSRYTYNRSKHAPSSARFRFQAHQARSQIVSRIPGQLSRPFTKYGPPSHSTSSPTTHGYRVQQHRNKLQYHVDQQQSSGFDDGLMKQEVPSPIRNIDFAEVNPIASQNNEPFGMHTANYLPPQNQKLPAYTPTDNFTPQSQSLQGNPDHGQVHSTNSQSQNFVQSQDHQISDAAFFLSENAQAIQQLYGAPASNQDFAPGNDQFHDTGNSIYNPNDRFKNFESTSQNPQEFRGALPAYASGTLGSHETLEQIQSLEKDRLIVQLQQALAQAQTNSGVDAERYAQNQASFVQGQELLAAVSQQMKSHISTTPGTLTAFGTGNTDFSQSAFLSTTTADPLVFPFNYGVPTTTQSPTTTTTTTTTVGGVLTTQPSQSAKGDGTIQVASSQPALNQPGPSATGSPVEIYGGFVPTFITGTNLVPSFSTGVFTSGPVRPVQSSGESPTHFGIPIPTEPPRKPGSASSIPTTTTTPSSTTLQNQQGVALTPAAIPVRPIVTPLHPFATHPIAAPLHPAVLPANPTQVQANVPAVTSGVQTALINPVLYKPIKTIYPVYYYPNIAYQQSTVSSSYPWNYAPSYAQTKPVQIWK